MTKRRPYAVRWSEDELFIIRTAATYTNRTPSAMIREGALRLARELCGSLALTERRASPAIALPPEIERRETAA